MIRGSLLLSAAADEIGAEATACEASPLEKPPAPVFIDNIYFINTAVAVYHRFARFSGFLGLLLLDEHETPRMVV